MTQKTAVIFGGTGFVGRHIVRDLANEGYQIKVVTRVPESAFFLKTAGNVGQIVAVSCDYDDFDSISNVIAGAQVVVNCIAILYERGASTFTKMHSDLPESIATACAVQRVERFVHFSALGIEEGTSEYAKSKLEGESRVLKAFADATILRPSIIFGEDDDFFNKFAKMAGFLPFLPLIGGGKTKFQPVFVGDVAKAALNTIKMPKTGKNSPLGAIYELGGPEILTFKDIYTRLFNNIGFERPLVPMPFGLAKFQAFFLSLMPKPLLTKDQVESLKTDSIVDEKAKTLKDLEITPTALDTILPTYLIMYKPGGRFA